MPKTYTVITTELDEKSLRWAEFDPQLWLETVVRHRAACATKELYSIELKKALANPDISSISSNMEEVILNSDEITVAERNKQRIDMPTLDPAEMDNQTRPSFIAETPRSFLGGI